MNLLGLILGAVAISGSLGTVAWHAAASRRAADEERQSLTARHTALAAQLRQREVDLAGVREREEAANSTASAPSAPSFAAPTSPAPETSAPRAANSMLEWLEDPTVQVIYLAKQRAELPQTYGPFYRAANLSPEQIERLADLIIESRAHRHDLSEIARLNGIPFSDPEIVAEREHVKTGREERLRALLGESGFVSFQDYSRAAEIRTYVGRISGQAAIEGCPLGWQQADALAKVIANTCAEYRAGGNALLTQVDWKATEAQAAHLLDSKQMAFLRNDSPKAISSRRSSEVFTAVQRAMRELGITRPPDARSEPRPNASSKSPE